MTAESVAPASSAVTPLVSPETLVRYAEGLIPRMREEQDASDARGHYSDALHEEFRHAGF